MLAAGCEKRPREGDATPMGLQDPRNRRDVVALAEPVLACAWDDKVGFNFFECSALDTWTKSPLLREPATEATLVAMLSDARPSVRWLAAKGLATSERPPLVDAASAKRVVDAALGEQTSSTSLALGGATAAIDLHKTGLETKARAALEGGSRVEFRRGFARTALRHNPQLFPVLMQLARATPEDDVGHASVVGLRLAPPDRLPAVRELWLELADHPSVTVAESVYADCALYSECRPIYGALVSKLETRKLDGGIRVTFLDAALKHMTDPDARGRAVKLASQVVEDESAGNGLRSLALKLVASADGPSAVRLAQKYKSDGGIGGPLQSSAGEILEPSGRDAGRDATTR